ncbi:TonB-dependent receptor domain-containing protein [Brevundimonas sp.]|uniref:TonB-dependent receptor plug domain-containing protein n=1 Tax=Brevundimonas sp. TaxID=1871086 RepID=UPI003918C983
MTAVAAPAVAQDATTVDEVVVTGSRIARQDFVSSSPIVTVDAEDFQATGSVTIDSLLNDMPQFVPSINFTSNNPSNGGQANLNLRGLGTTRTLVLVNGRRLVPSNSSGVVDVNIIPTALIQNIEVISGGASAAYGGDALAGVANFILNENFEGIQFDAQYGITDRNDGETQSYSVTIGGNFDGGRGNAVLSVGRSVRGEIYNVDREFSRVSGPSGASPLGSTTFDANNRPDQAVVDAYFGETGVPLTGAFGYNNNGSIFTYLGTRNFQSPGGIDYEGFVTPGGDWAYNTGPLNYMALPLDRWNAYASGRYELTDSVEAYASALFTQYEAANELAATPAAGAVPATGFRVPVDNPFIPADLAALLASRPTPTSSFALDKRFTEVGGRRGSENYNVFQLTTGLRGALPISDWTWDAYMSYGHVDQVTTQTGNVSRSAVQRLLDAADGGASLCEGGFNPFGESNLSQSCINYIARSSINTSTTEQTIAEAVVQGRLFELPAGDARFALGAQYRQDNYVFTPDASLRQQNVVTPHINPRTGLADGGNVGGSEIAGFNPSNALQGDTNSVELFTELLIPVLSDLPFIQQLDVNLGFRYADYSTAGGTNSYKAEVDWAIVDGLRVRGGIQRAVRAPSIGELFAPLGTSFPAIGAPSATGIQGDPCDIRSSYRTGPNAAQVVALCNAQASAAAAPDYQFTNNQVPGLVGGNPNLTEETADSWTLGVVYQPNISAPLFSRISASLDYYSIEIEDVIGTVGAASALQGCFNAQGQNPTYDPNNAFCSLFSRDPLSGNVNNSLGLNQNQATLATSGIDAQIDWAFDMMDAGLSDLGSLSFSLVVGWLESRESAVIAGGPIIERVGTIDSVFGNTFPEWKVLTSANWQNGPFGVGVRWRRVGELTQFGTDNVLEPVHYFDLTGSWEINDTVSMRLGVNNVTDEQPLTFSPGVQANTDPSTYDVLGRRYFVGLTARF